MLEAFAIIQNTNISVAALDVKLADNSDCAPICYALDQKHVPFLFHTGYATGGVLDEYPKASILVKPATRAQLMDCVLGSMGKRGYAVTAEQVPHLGTVPTKQQFQG